jgi:hypothetical protein
MTKTSLRLRGRDARDLPSTMAATPKRRAPPGIGVIAACLKREAGAAGAPVNCAIT